jgi:plasmid stabilization system protein ParE
MPEPVILRHARTDCREVVRWYRSKDRRAGDRLADGIERGLVKIAEGPESWPMLDDDFRFYKVRRYPVLIIYRLVDEIPYVVAIVHASQDDAAWRRREA